MAGLSVQQRDLLLYVVRKGYVIGRMDAWPETKARYENFRKPKFGEEWPNWVDSPPESQFEI